MEETQLSALTLNPIGIIRTARHLKFEALPQPDHSRDERSVVELLPGQNFEQALRDLDGFSHIWLIWWFHRNSSWRPIVLPPRGNNKKRGVLATRSPHRPNPIGITAVKLLGISGRSLIVGSNDLLDETPILDIKPYLPSADSFSDARSGWVAEVDDDFSSPPEYLVELSEQAARQSLWLKDHNVEILPRALEILRRYPHPHRTRRITTRADGTLRMGCGAWRIFFMIADKNVTILRFSPGYPKQALLDSSKDRIPNRDEQIEFLLSWPENID